MALTYNGPNNDEAKIKEEVNIIDKKYSNKVYEKNISSLKLLAILKRY